MSTYRLVSSDELTHRQAETAAALTPGQRQPCRWWQTNAYLISRGWKPRRPCGHGRRTCPKQTASPVGTQAEGLSSADPDAPTWIHDPWCNTDHNAMPWECDPPRSKDDQRRTWGQVELDDLFELADRVFTQGPLGVAAGMVLVAFIVAILDLS